jgi:hypothetical protein
MSGLKNFVRALAFIVALALLSPAAVFAQETVSFKISPTLIEEKLEPGSTYDFAMNIQNLGTADALLFPVARNIISINDQQQPVFSSTEGEFQYELASWITYKESQISLLPGESSMLHFKVAIPADASPGSHMAGLFLSSKPAEEVRGGSAIALDVGSIIHFQIAGEIVQDTRIREFFSEKTVYGAPGASFTINVENLGNILSRPRGMIDITNMFGKKVASLPVNEDVFGIFPKKSREFKSSWAPEDMHIGRFEAVVALSIEGPQGNQTISRVLQFWILPMNLIMPILGGLLGFILVVYFLLRLYVNRQLAGYRRVGSGTQSTGGLSRLSAVVIGLLVAVIISLVILFFFFG